MKLDAFLQFNGREVLKDAGRISAEIAKDLALNEYEKYRIKRLSHEIDEPDEDIEWILDEIESKIEEKQ